MQRPQRQAKTVALHLLFPEGSEEEDEEVESLVGSEREYSSAEENDSDGKKGEAGEEDNSDESELEETSEAEEYCWRRKHQPPVLETDTSDAFPAPPEKELSPLDYFHLFMKADFIDYLVEETNRYSVEKTGRSINCTKKEMEMFIGILLLMGVVKLPSYRLYWSQFYRYAPIADVMGCSRFETIKTYFHVKDNCHLNLVEKLVMIPYSKYDLLLIT
jgi:hypothetical protein